MDSAARLRSRRPSRRLELREDHSRDCRGGVVRDKTGKRAKADCPCRRARRKSDARRSSPQGTDGSRGAGSVRHVKPDTAGGKAIIRPLGFTLCGQRLFIRQEPKCPADSAVPPYLRFACRLEARAFRVVRVFSGHFPLMDPGQRDAAGSRLKTSAVFRPICVHSPAISEPSSLSFPSKLPPTAGVSKRTAPARSVSDATGIRVLP